MPNASSTRTALPAIDYVNAHIWPQNWSWADPKDLAGTWPTVERNTRDYIARQIAIARRLGKPLVIEEFGFPRDGGSFDPGTPTTFKDRFYQLIYSAVLDSVRSGGPLQGCNFWGWGGEGRAQHADHHFVRGRHELRRRSAARAAGLVQRLRCATHRRRRSSAHYASALKSGVSRNIAMP